MMWRCVLNVGEARSSRKSHVKAQCFGKQIEPTEPPTQNDDCFMIKAAKGSFTMRVLFHGLPRKKLCENYVTRTEIDA